MDLLRVWRRRMFGAAGAGVLAPVAIVAAALAVGVGGGGVGGLGALGQTLTGPQLPGIDIAQAEAASPSEETGRLLARANPPRAPGTSVRSVRPASERAARRRRSARRRARRRGTVRQPDGLAAGVPTAAPSSNLPQQQRPPSPPPSSTIRQVGDRIKEVTDPLPVAGEPAGEVVDLIVQTVEELPIPPEGAAPTPRPAPAPALVP